MRAGRITRIFFGFFLLLNLLSFSVSLPALTKAAFDSTPAINAKSAAAPKLLNSKTTLSPTESALDLEKIPPDKKKITCLTIGSRGDVQPYIALCQGLIEKGHACTIATHEKFRDWIIQSGVAFRPLAGDPEELIKHCTKNGMKSFSFWWKGWKRFGPWFDELLDSAWEASQGSNLLIESPSVMVGAHIAQSLNIPYIRAFTMPWTKTGVYPHAMAAMGTYWGEWMNRLSYKLFDGITWLLTRRKVNRWRETKLNLRRTTLAELQLSKVPFLYNFSPHVAPKPSDWGDLIKVTGYWFVKQKQNPANIPKDLEKAIENAKRQNKKIVYIGFGSIIVPDPKKMTDAIVGAVEESKVFAIISGGWTAGAAEGATKGAAEGATKGTAEGATKGTAEGATKGSTEATTKGATKTATEEKTEAEKEAEIATAYMKEKIGQRPNSMHYVDSVPHEWLFPQISAALHHGGAGTTAASIRAGIPTLIKPFFGDQTFWAQRVEKLGVGTHVASLDKKDIADALFKATTNKEQIEAAKALGKQVDSEDGVKIAIDSIFNYMDASHSLIQKTRAINLKKKPRPSSTKLDEIKVQLTKIMEDLPFGGIWRTVRLRKQPPESQSSSKTSSEAGHIALMEKKPSEKVPLLPTQ